jgi:P4 family phage/plasmid primase-like protien
MTEQINDMNNVTEPQREVDELQNANNLMSREVSFFNSVFSRESNRRIKVREVLKEIESGKYSAICDQLRNCFDKDKRHEIKKNLPAVTFSAQCDGGRARDVKITKHSSIICLDVDNLESIEHAELIKRKMVKHSSVFAAFVSPSGCGVKALALVDPQDHLGCFMSLEQDFAAKGIEIDPSTKDEKRLCFLSSDPEIVCTEAQVEAAVPMVVQADENDNDKKGELTGDVHSIDLSKHGDLLIRDQHGTPKSIDSVAFARTYADNLMIKHDPVEAKFYIYDSGCGLWKPITENRLSSLITDYAIDLLRANKGLAIQNKVHPYFQRQVIAQLKGDVEFEFPEKGKKHIHVLNGILEKRDDGFELCEFSPDYYSRVQLPIAFDPGADCPRFKGELLRPNLSKDDFDALKMVMGQIVLGRNISQILVVLVGRGGNGKSTLLSIIQLLVALENVVQLRMDALGGRFEMSNYLRKSLIYGSDVSAHFLSSKNAGLLKSLTGGDRMRTEFKHGNDLVEFNGSQNIFLTANSRLRVKLEGDFSAWHRRLFLIDFKGEPPSKPIVDFDMVLIDEEGPGILNFALEGLVQLESEMARSGRFPKTHAQVMRVERLLEESDSVRTFARLGLRQGHGVRINNDEMKSAYRSFCESRDWSSEVKGNFGEQVQSEIQSMWGESQKRDGKTRHWSNLEIV